MAIQLNVEDSEFGVPFPNAYHKIMKFSLARNDLEDLKMLISINVMIYATKPKSVHTPFIGLKTFNTRIEDIEAQTGADFLAKCYAWVMQQPDMANSTAV